MLTDESVISKTYLPAANAEKEAHHIGLLLLLKFLDILKGTHFGYGELARLSVCTEGGDGSLEDWSW